MSSLSQPASTSEPLAPAAKSALRKASFRLLPLIGIGYCIAYIDRVNISFAAVQMNRQLHFSATVYGLGAGLFFLTYVLFEIPSNLLLARFGARRWLARIMLTWGLISMAMVLVKTPTQFYALRLLLGAAEAGFFPGVIYYLTQWFPSSYRSRTFSRFYIAGPLASTVMGLLAATLLGLQGRLGLAGWQWLFLLEGAPALLMAVVFFVFLPDTPVQAKWLTSNERDALQLLHTQAGDAKQDAQASHAVMVVLRDVRVWLLGLYLFCIMFTGYAYAFVAPTLLMQLTGRGIGYVGNLIAGFGVLAAVGMLVNGWHSDRTGERFWHILAPTLAVCAGCAGAGLLRTPSFVLLAITFLAVAQFALQIPFLTLAPDFLRSKVAAAGIAAVNSIGLVGGFLGPYWMGHAVDLMGSYRRSLLTLTVPVVVACGLIVAFHRINTKRKPLPEFIQAEVVG
jgi:ACS family tartrate transporter-like MFS transporter